MSKFDPKDLYPYRPITERPPVKWPNGARVALWIAPNIEHFHIDLFNSPPDVKNYARRDYGNRVGIWRIMEIMQKYGARGTVALNSEVCKHYPQIIEKATELKWEFMGHGTTNSITFSRLDMATEEKLIAETKGVIESLGHRMRGWLGPALEETWNTLPLLKKYGVEYVADWVHDDLPVRFSNGLYSIPYTVDLNDMPLFIAPSVSTEEFLQRVRDAFDVLYSEGAKSPRVMCLSIHPFLIGVPHRIKYFDLALEYIAKHSDVWFATGSEIIQAFRDQEEPAVKPAK
jgi:allantoinase